MKTITTILFGILMCAGCREEAKSVHRAQTDSSSNRKDDTRISAIEREMADMPQKLSGAGWKTMLWGNNLARSIMVLDDRDERMRLMKLYLNSVTKLATSLHVQHDIPLAYWNYEELIGTCTIFEDEPEIAERILDIMCDGIRLHRHEIEKWANAINSEQNHRRRVSMKNVHGCLDSYFMMFTNHVERTYFPWMKEHGLPAERHEHWRRQINVAYEMKEMK